MGMRPMYSTQSPVPEFILNHHCDELVVLNSYQGDFGREASEPKQTDYWV